MNTLQGTDFLIEAFRCNALLGRRLEMHEVPAVRAGRTLACDTVQQLRAVMPGTPVSASAHAEDVQHSWLPGVDA